MKKTLRRLTVLLLILLTACGSDLEMDQNLNDPRNIPGQSDTPPVNDDTDNDGISNANDQCPDTPAGEEVDENGCSSSQLDSDNDGVNDAEDQCPDTPENEEVDANGCSATQTDGDGDGVLNEDDECPNTPEGEEVNEQGCSASQIDSDGDGVFDDVDECPDTPEGEDVNEQGCSPSQTDSDGDGVFDDVDECPDTSEGEAVNEQGCALSQLDSDQDGVSDDLDECPETPEGDEVDETGCSPSQKDSDMDGVPDLSDECPDTPEGREVNEQGCHTPEIGEYFQGGYVFYIFQPGDDRYVQGEIHGLIAATEEFEEHYRWMPEGANYERVFYEDESRDGEINTAKIVETYGEGVYAAKVCYDLELNGYDDWYLASGVENAILCINLAHSDDPEIADGYSRSGQYWTSFEVGPPNKSMPKVVYGTQWFNGNIELRSKTLLPKDDFVYECFVTSFDICQTDDMYSKIATQPVIAIRQF